MDQYKNASVLVVPQKDHSSEIIIFIQLWTNGTIQTENNPVWHNMLSAGVNLMFTN